MEENQKNLKCNMCGGNMKYIEHRGTYIWVCEDCPNLQLEYIDLTDYTALGSYLLGGIRKE